MQTTVSPGEDFSTQIVLAIADARNTDPVELEPRLSEVVDPGALDALLRGGSGEASVSFEYAGYAVVAHADGRIIASELSDTT